MCFFWLDFHNKSACATSMQHTPPQNARDAPLTCMTCEALLDDASVMGFTEALSHRKETFQGRDIRTEPCYVSSPSLLFSQQLSFNKAFSPNLRRVGEICCSEVLESGVARGLLHGRPLQLPMGWGVGKELTKSWPTFEQLCVQNLAPAISYCFFSYQERVQNPAGQTLTKTWTWVANF